MTMPVSDRTVGVAARSEGQPALPQYSRSKVLTLWLASALPMGALAWIVTPAVAGAGASSARTAVTLLVALTVGLLWQMVLVLVLTGRERRITPGVTIRDQLWIRAPHTAGRRGGRLWLWAVAGALALAALDMVPFGPTGPDSHSFGVFLGSAAGQATFHHAWGLYALVVVELFLNTVIGEELLFRGLLLPRMEGAFGRGDWWVNGLLFGVYHLHEPWVIPNAIITGWLCAGPTRRFRSSLMGIAIHSIEAVFFLVVLLPVVIG